jgi:predicted AlkP superfamily phosphohydrolase/phosphomutase
MAGPLWILSWDGAAPWLTDRALAEGALPNLERLRARGTSAAGAVADNPDVSTPPGHALLWTGQPSSVNGITSFRIPSQPDGEHDLLRWTSGFDARLLRAEPIWVTAARTGRSSTLVHTPLSGPSEVWAEVADKVKVFHGFGELRYPAGVVSNPLVRTSLDWKGLPFDITDALEFQYRSKPLSVPVMLLKGESGAYDRIYIAASKDRGAPGVFVEVGPDGGFSDPLDMGDRHSVRFRAFAMEPDGTGLVLYSSDSFQVDCSPADTADAYHQAHGAFTAGGSYRSYGDGDFGPPLTDGVAEARYMETHDLGMLHFEDSSLWAVEHHPADLMVFYNPGIDEVQHVWAGFVAEGEPCFDPARAELVWPWIREAYARADRHLGRLLDALPEDGTLALVSDHGISGIWKHFLPNVALKKAGLLKTKRGNGYRIDLARTKAIYHPANNCYVFVNSTRYPGGIVKDEDREEVLDKATEALKGVLDPDTGEAVLAHVIRIDRLPEDSDMRGQGRGDLFLALKHGYSLGESLHQDALLPAHLSGHHQQHPGLRTNHAIFELAGPGVKVGHELGVVSQRDVHETFRRVLGLA